MSGIAGYLGTSQAPAVLRAMSGRMTHRGAEGEYFYEVAPVFMALRRFDAGQGDGAGAQPVFSDDRTMAAMLAGEFHNFAEEREALEGRGASFETGSPAEVLLRLYEVYGVACVNRMRGSFVFAVHDQQKDLVFIARDAVGSKPLYYATTQSGTFVFASEIKALFEHPGITAEPDPRGIDAYLSLGYSPGPDAMFRGVHKLPPGHRIIWNPGLHVMIEPYWQWDSFAKADPVLKGDADFEARFAALFEEAVRLRLEEGQPALWLTGSLESAAIAAAAAKAGAQSLPAFCIDIETDGVVSPSAVAAKLGFKGEEIAFGAHDMDKLPEIIWALDEPVADIALSPLYLMARNTRRVAGAALHGAGATELFTAHPAQGMLLRARAKPKTYYAGLRTFYSALPQASLGKALGFGGKIGPYTKQRIAALIDALREGGLQRQQLAIAGIMTARDKHDLYQAGELSHVIETYADLQKDPAGWPTVMSTLMAAQAQAALPDGVLAPAEKIAMFSAVSLRQPFTDPRLAEFLIGLPDHLRGEAWKTKVLLRNYLAKTQPELMAPAPPGGSRLPLGDFIAASPLKEMTDTCLSEASMRRRGLFEWETVKNILAGAKTGEGAFARQVFALLTLEIWFRIYVDHEKGWLSA